MLHDTTSQWTSDLCTRLEYAAALGDKRLTRRAQALGLALSRKPELSLPKLLTDEAELEAAYRLIRNDRCHWRELLAPHIARTVERAADYDTVLVAHDTTTLAFRRYWPDKTRGQMAKLTSRTQGLLFHAGLAISGGASAMPLGLLHAQPFVHGKQLDDDDDDSQAFWEEEGGLYENEMRRWFCGVGDVDDTLRASGVSPVHVMDSETDSYGLLSWLQANGMRFVVRGTAQRRLEPTTGLREVGQIRAELGERFPLRSGKRAKRHPTRAARVAQLTVRAGEVTLSGPKSESQASWSPFGFASQPDTLTLNLVEVVELEPPNGATPVRWILLTTEPIEDDDQVLQVVTWYRRRWLVEEYFKALKSGCRIEERQMECAANMLRILALLLPAAWRLLLLRTVARDSPELRWSMLLTPLEFRLLRRRLPKAGLSEEATVQQCLTAIAKLGGHLKRNGRPGWQSLQTGWRQLQDLALGVRLVSKDAINP